MDRTPRPITEHAGSTTGKLLWLPSSTSWLHRFPCRRFFLLSFLTIAGSGCAKDEDTLETRLARANDYFAADQYDKATTEYREVLRLAPTDPVALRRLGIIYHDQGQIVQAYPLLKEATELLPEDSEAQLKFGFTLLSLGQFAEARDSALQVLDKQPGDEQALVLLADTAGSPANTVEEIRTLVHDRRTQDHDRPGYHLALGSLDLRQKEEVRAEGEFKRTLELDPRSGAAHSALGVLYWTRNDLKAAEQEFKAAADLVPGRSPIRMRYADFLLQDRLRRCRQGHPGGDQPQNPGLPAAARLPDANGVRQGAGRGLYRTRAEHPGAGCHQLRCPASGRDYEFGQRRNGQGDSGTRTARQHLHSATRRSGTSSPAPTFNSPRPQRLSTAATPSTAPIAT